MLISILVGLFVAFGFVFSAYLLFHNARMIRRRLASITTNARKASTVAELEAIDHELCAFYKKECWQGHLRMLASRIHRGIQAKIHRITQPSTQQLAGSDCLAA